MTTAKIRGIDHIGITVPDIDVETKFLVEALCAEIIYESNCLSFMHLCTGNLLVPVTTAFNTSVSMLTISTLPLHVLRRPVASCSRIPTN